MIQPPGRAKAESSTCALAQLRVGGWGRQVSFFLTVRTISEVTMNYLGICLSHQAWLSYLMQKKIACVASESLTVACPSPGSDKSQVSPKFLQKLSLRACGSSKLCRPKEGKADLLQSDEISTRSQQKQNELVQKSVELSQCITAQQSLSSSCKCVQESWSVSPDHHDQRSAGADLFFAWRGLPQPRPLW